MLDRNDSKFISAWFWMVIGIIFLCFSLLFFTIGETVFFVSFLFLWAFCTFMSYRRRKELEDE